MSDPLERDPLDEEETWDEGGWEALTSMDCGPVDIQSKVRSRRRGAEPGRRHEVECLLAELMAVPEEQRHGRLEEPRFQEPLLFELLVEAGHARLLGDPEGANEILGLATRLVTLLSEIRSLDRDIEGEGLSNALCLAGTARRLRGDYEGAESAFARAGDLAASPLGLGFLGRALGVLRWDQGRREEAIALLHQAHLRFDEAMAFKDGIVCLALLGLLHLEEGTTREARAVLQASADLDCADRPWLAAQIGLGRAFCFAAAGERKKARAARHTAWRFYEKVTPEEALLSVYWLEGRVAALMGDFEDAANLLGGVRQKRIERRCLAEATLTTIDLGLVWLAAGREEEVGPLVEEIAVAFEGHRGLDLALGALTQYAEDLAAGQLDEELWRCIVPGLRLAFRHQGVQLRPVPFV